MLISDIGYTNDTALLCNTNHPPPPTKRHSGGDWYAPNGTKVNFTSVTGSGFRINRGPMVVRLKKRTDTDAASTGTGTPPEGIYRCSIKDAVMIRQRVYVGLYNSGGGNTIIRFLICKRLALPTFVFNILRASHTVW